MAQKLSQLSAGNVTATFPTHIQRILLITAEYYGLVHVPGVGRHVGGPQT